VPRAIQPHFRPCCGLLETRDQAPQTFLEKEAPRLRVAGRYVITGELGPRRDGYRVTKRWIPMIGPRMCCDQDHSPAAARPTPGGGGHHARNVSSVKARFCRSVVAPWHRDHFRRRPGKATLPSSRMEASERGVSARGFWTPVQGWENCRGTGHIAGRQPAALDYAHQNGVVHRDV